MELVTNNDAPAQQHAAGSPTLETTTVPRAIDIMGKNFRPFTFGREHQHFQVEIPPDRNLMRVPWEQVTLAKAAEDSILVCVPAGLSIRRMAQAKPKLFELDLHHSVNKCPYLDWEPQETSYRLLCLRPRRPHTSIRDGEVLSSLHAVAYAMVLGIEAGRQLFGGRVTLYDHRGNLAAAIGYSYKGIDKIEICRHAELERFGLYELEPHATL